MSTGEVVDLASRRGANAGCPAWCSHHIEVTDADLDDGPTWEHRRTLATAGGWSLLVLLATGVDDGDAWADGAPELLLRPPHGVEGPDLVLPQDSDALRALAAGAGAALRLLEG